ncbi:hypothetical protein [Aureimonas leprariae]|uniref:Uncharacterized protein n=1 Tax=Plantimonas leprariae TaxID=2615207 RepID=A0A7V7PPW7_9HYPH|nr:hypothetical protein [Aureimonas leprariae]KAB0680081.1 hypothetical protein F6X38_09735 [Aureimonas leprariae]
MGTLENRVAKLEQRSGTDLPQYGRVFMCTGRMGHEDEDRAEQLAEMGVVQRNNDLVIQLVGYAKPPAV